MSWLHRLAALRPPIWISPAVLARQQALELARASWRRAIFASSRWNSPDPPEVHRGVPVARARSPAAAVW